MIYYCIKTYSAMVQKDATCEITPLGGMGIGVIRIFPYPEGTSQTYNFDTIMNKDITEYFITEKQYKDNEFQDKLDALLDD